MQGEPLRTIGPYRVLRPLGRGGMGTVYLVEDPASGAQRAVKLLGPLADLEERRRFDREGQAMAAVDDHPHVLRIHGAGRAGASSFLVMEHAPGGDLAARLERGPLPPDEVVRLGTALARGLAHVHARGVLHRDLKPSNVLFDETGAPRLTDFGLARVAGEDRLTRTGTVLGTPAYMAPEQANAAADVDGRTDVYGLGALLYHALTGRAPFEGPSSMAVLEQVLTRAPTPPRALAPGASRALEAVILRALAKAPQDRFPSADALAEALDACERAPRGSSQTGWRVVVGALAVALLVATALALGPGRVDDPGTPAAPARVTSTPLVSTATPQPSDTRDGSPSSAYRHVRLLSSREEVRAAWLDDALVVTCGATDDVRLFDAATGEERARWPLRAPWAARLEGGAVLLADSHLSLQRLEAARPGAQPVRVLPELSAVRFLYGGRGQIVAMSLERVHVLDARGQLLDSFECDPPAVRAAVSAGCGTLALGQKPEGGADVDALLQLRDRATGRVRRVDVLGRVNALDLSPDGRRLFAGTGANQLLIIDLERGVVDGDLILDEGSVPGLRVAHRGVVEGVVASHDGRLLYSCSAISGMAEGELRVWDVDGRRQACAPVELVGRVKAVELAPGGGALLLPTSGAGVHVVPLGRDGLPLPRP